MLSVSKKILLSFCVLMIASGVTIAYSLSQNEKITKLNSLHSQERNSTHDIKGRLSVASAKYNAGVEALLSILDIDLLKDKSAKLEGLRNNILELLDAVEVKDPERYSSTINSLREEIEAMSKAKDHLVFLIGSFAQMQANELYREKVEPLKYNIDSDLESIAGLIEQKYEIQQREIEQKLALIQMNSYALIGILSLLYILTGLMLWRGTISPINRLTNYLKKPFSERSAMSIPFTKRNDELGDFSRSFMEMLVERDAAEALLRDNAIRLHGAVKQATAANAAKSEFLANMSHELRTPLNSILGIVEIIKKRGLADEQKEMFDVIDHSSGNLLKIVNDILDLSKIEAGETKLEIIPFEVSKEIGQTLESLKPLASKKGFDFIIQNDLDEALTVMGDPLRLSRIIINLVNNAISYTDKGSVTVKVFAESLSEVEVDLNIEVVDTGIGIAPDKIDKIFEKFTQADMSTTRKYGGTGLGLAITQELVDMMGGEMGVKSKENVGSTFWVEIPFKISEEEARVTSEKTEEGSIEIPQNGPKKPASVKPVSEIKILIAEDERMNLVFMEKLFETYGIDNYKTVNDGLAALNSIKSEEYDLVLMDCHMPEMNGFETTEAIRNLSDETKSAIPVIAMTANVMEQDIQKFKDIGANAFLGKPFDLAQFEQVLSEWVDFSEEQDAA